MPNPTSSCAAASGEWLRGAAPIRPAGSCDHMFFLIRPPSRREQLLCLSYANPIHAPTPSVVCDHFRLLGKYTMNSRTTTADLMSLRSCRNQIKIALSSLPRDQQETS